MSAFSRRFLILLVLSAGFLGCRRMARAEDPPAIPTTPGTHSLKLGERTYLLHVPKGFKKGTPAPLVIAFHGALSSGLQMEKMTGLDDVADAKGFVVAYPDGMRRLWNYGEGSPDVEFSEALVDALVAAKVADPKRMYATGMSNGAYMVNRLAVDLSDKIAAIAPVAGSILKFQAPRMTPPRPMPVFLIHGTEDKIVGFDGVDAISGQDASLGAAEVAAFWVKANGCNGLPTEVEMPDADKNDGCTGTRFTWKHPIAGPTVEFIRITGGGHTWPGMPSIAERVLGKSCQDFKASELIWEYFSKQVLPDKKK